MSLVRPLFNRGYLAVRRRVLLDLDLLEAIEVAQDLVPFELVAGVCQAVLASK